MVVRFWIFFVFLSFSLLSVAGALKPGQCVSDPLTKNYLQSILGARGNVYQGLIEEIGVEKFRSLRDSSDRQYYFCQVTCADSNGNLSKLWITQSDSPSNFSNMNGFLCHSVSIENVVIVGSITSPQPVATPFYAFLSDIDELHNWLQSIHFHLSPQDFSEQSAAFAKTSDEIVKGYLASTSDVLRQAGFQIWEIGHQTDTGKSMIEEKLKLYQSLNWKTQPNYQSPDYFVFLALKTFGRFLQYPPLPEPVETAPELENPLLGLPL